MPASMISDAVGGRWKVIGSSMAIVATGPDAGQHADQRADHASKQGIGQVLERDSDTQAEGQVAQQIHIAIHPT